MSLLEQIQKDQIDAMKNRDEIKLSILRIVWSTIKNEQIERQKELSDEMVQTIILQEIKKLKDSVKDFEQADRSDLVARTQKEINLLMTYAPTPLTDKEIHDIITSVIEKTNANSPKDIGRVMGQVMKEVKGKADGNEVRKKVQELLTKNS